MRIGCLQFAPQVGDVDNNLNRADAVLSKANADDLELDLLVLPELAFTGYNFKSLQEITPFLEPSGSGITALWARTTALKYNCVVTVGYPEKVDVSPKWPTGPEYYNAVIVVNGDGETIVNYRKSFLYYTDETWALEGGRGFYDGFIPGLGNTSIGICMDINPYKFEAPWHAFEFAFHILEVESNLVIVSMAWLTWEDHRLFTRSPNEPDMETLKYWVTRLEPIIRSENQDEIIVVFCNRTGYEGDVTYAGTSAVVGIQDGEVKVYGLLGRGEKELLVVDTNDTPYAKLVYQSDQRSGVQLKEHAESSCLAGGSTGTSGSAGPNAMVISESDQVKQQCGNIDSNSSTPPNKGEHGRQQCKSENAVTTSASPMSEQSHRHSKTSSFSSSQALEQRTSSARTPQSPRVKIPDRLNLTNQNYSVKSPETDSTLIPTPSGPSPTPMAIRPRLQIPESSFGPPQSYIVENPCSAASQKSSHSLQSIKSDDSEASTMTVTSNPRPPEDSTPYPHSGATLKSYRNAFRGDNSTHSSFMASSSENKTPRAWMPSKDIPLRSPRWFWRPPETLFRTSIPLEPEFVTPVVKKSEPDGKKTAPAACASVGLGTVNEHHHARAQSLGREHRIAKTHTSYATDSPRKSRRQNVNVMEPKKVSQTYPPVPDFSTPSRKDWQGDGEKMGLASAQSTAMKVASSPLKQAHEKHEMTEEIPALVGGSTVVPERPPSPKSRNCSRSRPSDPADFYRDFQTIPIAASPSILSERASPIPAVEHWGQIDRRPASRMGYQKRSNSMTNIPSNPYNGGNHWTTTHSARRASSRGRQPESTMSSVRPGGQPRVNKRASSADSTRNAVLHSRTRKSSTHVNDRFNDRFPSHGPGSGSRRRPSMGPNGEEFTRVEAIVCPSCPVHGRQHSSVGNLSDLGGELSASSLRESMVMNYPTSPSVDSTKYPGREMMEVRKTTNDLRTVLIGHDGATQTVAQTRRRKRL
ncbi:hypothetical protein HIM_11412 [Hirsutella minnesotensis 3608]|uniref:CN hydrolase domain-containing protein n=1 Tax=Hirsutella minnesotensis 3608 TaxID=1043627 RepID=A0A0F7ZJ30_9HYPO|nr:hypothetical protein HIM_11412 [Hirsutella minnesotensis 3608]